jgi:hypothetical protein
MNQKSNDEKVYYSKCNLMRRGKDAPLEKAVFTVSGEVSFVEKKEGQYGNFLAVTMTAVLPDKSVERHFGPELVNPEHKVEFRFLLSGFYAELFERYTPRWGQDIIFMLYDMKIESFKRRSGELGYNVSAKCCGYTAIGSTKKADGTERPAIKIKGQEKDEPSANADGENKYKSVREVMDNYDIEIDDDEELPF